MCMCVCVCVCVYVCVCMYVCIVHGQIKGCRQLLLNQFTNNINMAKYFLSATQSGHELVQDTIPTQEVTIQGNEFDQYINEMNSLERINTGYW